MSRTDPRLRGDDIVMKTSQDPRHQLRITLMQKLFAVSFQPPQDDSEIHNIYSHLSEIDTIIRQAAPEWPLEKIARIDLAILRLAVYELRIEAKEPQKVVIDEAIELSKSYGNPNSASFINGALGAVVQQKEETVNEKA